MSPFGFRLILLALCLALPLSHVSVRGAAEPSPYVVEHVKRAVVIVKAFDGRGRLLTQGSGFFVGPRDVVTNLHVVGRAARVEVLTFGGETCRVEGLAASDPARDLALMRVGADAGDVETLEVESAETLAGEGVFVVSNPRGSLWQVSEGEALAPREFPEIGRLVPLTARVARGSSGGPVVNMRGRVVGVATMSLRKSSVEEYFALPAEDVARLRPGAPKPFPLHVSE